MFADKFQILKELWISPKNRPILRYAIGATLIMAISMLTGNPVAYIIPFLSLTFLGPGAKPMGFKKSVVSLIIVALSTLFGYLFTSFFYEFTYVYIPLLIVVLFWIYYTEAIPYSVKIFVLISLLASPLPPPYMNTEQYAKVLAIVLTFGMLITFVVTSFVFALIPDRLEEIPKQNIKPPEPENIELRLHKALKVLIITLPVILIFLFYRLNDEMILVTYIVLYAIYPRGEGWKAGKAKIVGNILGGVVTLIFFHLLTIVPNFLFFIVFYLALAIFFARRIFSGKTNTDAYQAAFAVMTMIIGESVLMATPVGSAIYLRVFLITASMLYIVLAFRFLDNIIIVKKHLQSRKLKNNIVKI